MLQRSGGLDLGHESLATDDRGQLRPQDLDGHLPIVLQVVGQVDGGHSAGPQLSHDVVAVGQGGDEAILEHCHPVHEDSGRLTAMSSGPTARGRSPGGTPPAPLC